jgi:hypothetical protein
MVATGLAAGLAGFRRRLLAVANRKMLGSVAGLAFVGMALIAPVKANAAVASIPVSLAPSALTSSALAGSGTSTLSGAAPTLANPTPADATVTVNFAATCGGAAVASNNPTSIVKVATLAHVGINIPGSLTTGNYFVSLAGALNSGATCSEIQVTATTSTLAACVPTSSLAVVAGTNVDAFVPNGYWSGSATGIDEVSLEGTSVSKTFATPGIVNSCAANSTTGEVVCTENTANVDLIIGSTLTTIASGSNGYAGFSGGDCENCGVGINAANNTAVIGMGLAGSPSSSGVQVLNLTGTSTGNTFNAAFPLTYEVSEDISIDSGRNLILSPDESSYYDLLKIGSGNSLTEYSNYISNGGELDSAAEDCTTGIALASIEFTSNIYITDLTQAVFTSGTPGTWTAPGQTLNLDDDSFYAGTCGISSAPGTNHLAVVTGEFGGNSYAVLKLPATSGSGTPNLVDWAYVASMPNTPDGGTFSAGYDPHTVTAYTSPNTGKSYAVFADYEGGSSPTYLGVVDLACVLSQTRSSANYVSGTASACTTYVALP